MNLRYQHCSESCSGGFTLVEVMLALLLSGVLILGLADMFSTTTGSYQLIEGRLRMQESASYALGHIAAHLRSSGDFGCAARASVPLKTLRGGWSRLFEFDLRTAIGGIGGDVFSQALANQRLAVSQPVDNRKTYVGGRGISTKLYVSNSNNRESALLVANSDIIVTRRLGTPHFQLAAPVAFDDEIKIRLSDRNGDGNVNLSDLARFGFSGSREPILLLGDCSHRTLFRIHGMRRQGQIVRLERRIGTDNSPFANGSMQLLPPDKSFQTDAIVGPVETRVFFIATGRGLNNQRQPVLSLWQKTGINRPRELVEGIERLIFYAGIDTDGDKIPNQYQAFSALTDFTAIVSIRFMVIANSVNTVARSTTGDAELLRHAYGMTVWLRNL